ncbi:class I tRNA ligase family protein [Actinomadura luteofluorescens]
MLLSAGLPLPDEVLVHGYLTVGGRKISKSGGTVVDPVDLVREFGVDAVRWWLLREVPRSGDADFTADRLVARADDELANGLGNLVQRVVSMVHRYRGGVVPDGGARELDAVCREAPAAVDAALAGFDFRRATGAVWRVVDEANRYVNRVRPWDLAKEGDPRLDAVLAGLVAACRTAGELLEPFLPDAAARVRRQCAGQPLPPPEPLFPRLR